MIKRLTRYLPPRNQWLLRLRWQLVYWQQILGFWGVLALGIMTGTLLVKLTLIGPALEQDALRRQELQSAIAERPQDVQVTEPAAIEKLPDAQAFATRLEKILTLIQQQGFSIDQTTLSYSTPGDSGLQRLDIEIPLTGTYPALRQALAAVVQEPAIRIENLTLERKEIDAAHLTIGLKLSMLGVVE
jgi:hypothetical protein